MKKGYKLILTFILLISLLPLLACSGDFNISLGYKELTMYVGDTLYLNTNSTDFETENQVIWESSNESVATVTTDGKVEAKSVGFTYISATLDDKASTIFVNVLAPLEDLRTLRLNGKQMVVVGESINLLANVDLEKDEYVYWESSDDEIATVSGNGIVTGQKPGLVNIKATLSSDINIYDTITVLVRSGSGVQDVYQNYIITENYVLEGNYDISNLSKKVCDMVSAKQQAVVGVSNYQKDGASLSISSVGSGVIFKREAIEGAYRYTLLSNYHVIEKAVEVKIYIGGDVDQEFNATVLKQDSKLDLSLISFIYDGVIDPINLDFDTIVNSGDFVVAIGNPDGYTYYNSVTFWVASYVNRTLSGEKATYIQHDAAINPGNSGGALLDLDGNLIGINTLKIVKSTVEGMGFAIDLNTLKGFVGE